MSDELVFAVKVPDDVANEDMVEWVRAKVKEIEDVIKLSEANVSIASARLVIDVETDS